MSDTLTGIAAEMEECASRDCPTRRHEWAQRIRNLASQPAGVREVWVGHATYGKDMVAQNDRPTPAPNTEVRPGMVRDKDNVIWYRVPVHGAPAQDAVRELWIEWPSDADDNDVFASVKEPAFAGTGRKLIKVVVRGAVDQDGGKTWEQWEDTRDPDCAECEKPEQWEALNRIIADVSIGQTHFRVLSNRYLKACKRMHREWKYMHTQHGRLTSKLCDACEEQCADGTCSLSCDNPFMVQLLRDALVAYSEALDRKQLEMEDWRFKLGYEKENRMIEADGLQAALDAANARIESLEGRLRKELDEVNTWLREASERRIIAERERDSALTRIGELEHCNGVQRERIEFVEGQRDRMTQLLSKVNNERDAALERIEALKDKIDWLKADVVAEQAERDKLRVTNRTIVGMESQREEKLRQAESDCDAARADAEWLREVIQEVLEETHDTWVCRQLSPLLDDSGTGEKCRLCKGVGWTVKYDFPNHLHDRKIPCPECKPTPPASDALGRARECEHCNNNPNDALHSMHCIFKKSTLSELDKAKYAIDHGFPSEAIFSMIKYLRDKK